MHITPLDHDLVFDILSPAPETLACVMLCCGSSTPMLPGTRIRVLHFKGIGTSASSSVSRPPGGYRLWVGDHDPNPHAKDYQSSWELNAATRGGFECEIAQDKVWRLWATAISEAPSSIDGTGMPDDARKWFGLARAYQAAAMQLSKRALGSSELQSDADVWTAFPAIFLWRQALELTQKGCLQLLKPSEYSDEKLKNAIGHRLRSFDKVLKLVEAGLEAAEAAHLGRGRLQRLLWLLRDSIKPMYDDFASVDDGSFTSRYPDQDPAARNNVRALHFKLQDNAERWGLELQRAVALMAECA